MSGDSIADNNVYWDQYALSTVKPQISTVSGGDNSNAMDDSIFEPVVFDTHAPDTNVSFTEFWSIVAKNPNKSAADYHDSFNHNMPLPLLHEGELVYSFEGSQIYYNIVNQIIQMNENDVHFDHPILLKLVMDNIQIFERHWRKMVVDIRTGKLDKKLLIPLETRNAFESANVPRPGHAQRLDDAFRSLGFHKKVLGKDIEIKAYASKRSRQEIQAAIARNVRETEKELQSVVDEQWKASRRAISPSQLSKREMLMRRLETPSQVSLSNAKSLQNLPTDAKALLENNSVRIPTGGIAPNVFRVGDSDVKRKYSLPFEPSESSILSMSRPVSSVRFDANILTGTDISAKDAKTPLSPLRMSSATAMNKSRGNSATSNADAVFTSPKRVSSAAGKSKRDHLQQLSHTFFEQKEELQGDIDSNNKGLIAATIVDKLGGRELEEQLSHSRTGTGLVRRRKSQSEMQRPTTQEEVQESNYALIAAPRDLSLILEPSKQGERYLCPFPACGHSFYSRDAAMRHMTSHSQRMRMYAPTPQSDSHLRFYWPEDVPWLTQSKYTDKQLPPGSVRCTEPGCPEIFATFTKLQAHMRLVHQRIHPSNVSLGYSKFERNYRCIPPDPTPEDFNLLFCRLHATPVRRCPLCMEIETKDMPKPPFLLHESLLLDFEKKKDALSLTMTATEMKGLKKNSEGADSMVIRIHQRDHKHLLLVQRDASSTPSVEFKARAIFLLVDRNKIAYLGIESMYSLDEITARRWPVPFKYTEKHDMKKAPNKYELFPARSVSGMTLKSIGGNYCKMSAENVEWVPMHTVKRVMPLLYIKDRQFVHSNAGNPLDNLVDSIDQVPMGTHFTMYEP